MLKKIFLIPLLAIALVNVCMAADDYSYDKFYQASPGFKELDVKLNSLYKELMNQLPWQAKNSLLNEQRFWHNRLFSLLVKDRAEGKNYDAAATAILQERVANLERLLKTRQSSDILGMDISFGMTKSEIAKRLKLADSSKLEATPANEENPYKIRLFGGEVPIYFNFMTTQFKASDNENSKNFKNFASAIYKVAGECGDPLPPGSQQDNFKITTLVDLFTGGMESREDFNILNEELAKKYKIAYPQSMAMRVLLEEKLNSVPELEDDAFVSQGEWRIYEDRQRYIVVSGSWGTLTGEFNAEYISHPYLDMHIHNLASLIATINEISRMNTSLGILPANAGLKDIIYALGDRELDFKEDIGGYYWLETEFKYSESGSDTLRVYMTPDNRAYGIGLLYVADDPENNFEDRLLKRLARKFKPLKDTPENVVQFLGYCTDEDRDFETEDNYIHFGFTPHFMVQHEMVILSKAELDNYRKIQNAHMEKERAAEEEREEQVKEDVQKF